MKRFEIWLANLNPAKGTEPGKIRPVVIIQSDLLNKANHPSTLVCPVTTNLLPRETQLRVKIAMEFLDQESEILVDQIRAIDNRRLIENLGKLNAEKAFELKSKIQILLDL